MTKTVELTIPDDAWDPNFAIDDPTLRMVVTLEVNGYSMHLEAWRVEIVEGALQTHAAPPGDPDGLRDDFGMLHKAVGADGWFNTIKINGLDYILVATPYCC